jgi:hypothetical protein
MTDTTSDSAVLNAFHSDAQAVPWFAPAWTMLPLAARRCVVRNPLNGATMELSSGEYAVLSTCEGCRPLAEHETRAVTRLSAPPAHRRAFHELLDRCAAQGMFVPLPDLVLRFGIPQRQPPAPLAGIVVRTADRPQFLQRLLDGAAALQSRRSIEYSWHILDDSRTDVSRSRNREAVVRCSTLDLAYHDLWSDEPLEAELRRAFPRLEAEIELLLGRPCDGEATYGRPINHALLRFAGYRLLFLDDDVTIDPRRPALSHPGIDVSLAPEVAYRFENLEEGFRACPPLDCNPFAEHARWLGTPLADAWQHAERVPGGIRVGDLPATTGAAFAVDARVLFTRNQVLGDPGWDRFASPLLRLEPATRRWLAAHPDAARYAFASQVHWRGQTAVTLSPHHALSTTTLTGVDNSVLMPPVERFTRDADVLLGAAAECVHPAAWAVDLPFALPHLRAARRSWLRPDEGYVLSPSMMLITHSRAVQPSLRSPSPENRIRMLGACILDLATADDARLQSMLEEQALHYATAILFNIHDQLDDASLPPAWKDILRQWLVSPLFKLDRASLRALLADPREVRAEAMRFGKTLMVWPELWAYCRERPS